MMKDPYGKLINSKESMFNKLGFYKSIDNEHVTIFSNNDCSIEISAERYYLPSITTKLVDYEGNKYSMRIIREILDMKNLEKDSKDLDDVKRKYNLDNENTDKTMSRKGVEEYVKLSIEQLLDFLSKHSAVLVLIDDSLKDEYQRRNQDLLGQLGL